MQRYDDMSMAEMKKLWGEGPWQTEPDELSFEYKGFNCHLMRNSMGTWCGYVEISIDSTVIKDALNHEKEGIPYENLPIEVHGGITYGEQATSKTTGKECYVAGFDCAHLYDFMPSKNAWKDLVPEIYNSLLQVSKNDIYRDINFATHQIYRMVDQIIEYERTHE